MSFGSRSLPAATPDEAQRMSEIRKLGCIACRIIGAKRQCGATEIHHLLVNGLRAGHRFTIPLGEFHHQRTPLQGWNLDEMRALYGPSLRDGAAMFREHFASDQALLNMVDDLIAWPHELIPARPVANDLKNRSRKTGYARGHSTARPSKIYRRPA